MRSGESCAVSAKFPPAHSLLRTAAARCAGGRKRALATVVMATKGLDRKASAAGAEGKRMLILDQEKCKPMMPAHDFLKLDAKVILKATDNTQVVDTKLAAAVETAASVSISRVLGAAIRPRSIVESAAS